MRKLVGALAVLSLAAHLAYLPPTLEDLDSVNFALGVRHFDVAEHQPHPPGYPAFIALGKLGTWSLRAAGVANPEPRGLAIWSAIAAGILPLVLFAFFRSLDGDERRAGIATVLAVCCPLFWFNGVRPLSDMSGLAAACTALAALSAGLASSRTSSSTSLALVAGAFMSGLAIGFRSQMALLTVPMLLVAVVAVRQRWLAMIGAAAAGVAVWAIPLIVLSGGPSGYLRALGSQAGEDFSGVVMLWTNRTARVALAAFLQTFVRPWDSPVLAGIVLALAATGLLVLAMRSRRALALVLVTFGPYTVFHLLFQETVTLRYALPLIPLIAFLAAATLAEAEWRAAIVATIATAAAGLLLAMPAVAAFGRTPSPIFAMLSEMRLFEARGATPVVAMHRRVFTESRRARRFAGEVPGSLLPAPRDYEWLEVTKSWREGNSGETWFLADPRRTDLALIDHVHDRIREYRWPFRGDIYVGGTRPNEIDWHVIDDPGWFLEQGWALTPETAGIADRDGWGPHRRPSIGWVRRRPSPTLMMIGGRHLGGGAPVRVVARIDDKPVATMDVPPGYFLNFIDLPAGTLVGDGRYARLTVSGDSPTGGAVPPVGIEQFNLQDPARVQFGFGDGWNEPEYNPTTAKSWRWMAGRAVVRVHAPGRSVTLRFQAESPRHYFSVAPTVRVLAGDRVLAEFQPDADFTREVAVPADALSAAEGRLTLTSDREFVAGEREGTADRRRLALRVYSLTVE